MAGRILPMLSEGVAENPAALCDDAFGALCGGFLDSTDIPADSSTIDSSFHAINKETRRKVRSIVESWECPDPDAVHLADPIRAWRELAGCMHQACLAAETDPSQRARAEDLVAEAAPLVAFVRERLPFLLGGVWPAEDSALPGELARRLAALHANSAGAFLGWFAHQHPTDPAGGAVPYVVQSGLGLPFDFYESDDPHAARVRESYLLHAQRMIGMFLEAAGEGPAYETAVRARAEAVLDFERRVRSISLSPAEARDNVATTNLMRISEFAALAAPALDVAAFLRALEAEGVVPPGSPHLSAEAPVVVDAPAFYARLRSEVLFPAHLSRAAALSVLDDYMLLRAVRRGVGSLGGAWRAERERHQAVASGARPADPWKKCLDLTKGALPWVVGEAFVTDGGADAARRRAEFAESILDHVRTVFREEVRGLPWLDAATAGRALEKEAKVRASLGYPKWIVDPPRVAAYLKDHHGDPQAFVDAVAELNADTDADSGSGSVARVWPASASATLFRADLHLDRAGLRSAWGDLGQPTDRDMWYMTPDTVNAYYMGSTNDIVFPDSILRPPFLYVPGAEDSPAERAAKVALSYGAFGAVVGHELTHAFDDQGSTMDGDGRLVDWWTPVARQGFERAAQCMVDQYEAFVVPDLVEGGASQSQSAAPGGRWRSGAAGGAGRRLHGHPEDGRGHDHAHSHVLAEEAAAEGSAETRSVALRTQFAARDGRLHPFLSAETPPALHEAESGPPGRSLGAAARVNGRLTLGENIADAGGLRLAMLALPRHLRELNRRDAGGEGLPSADSEESQEDSEGAALLPGLPAFNAERLAVTSYGQIWCSKATPQAARQRAASDPHAPGAARVAGALQNLPEFEKLFGCARVNAEGKARVASEELLPLGELRRSCSVW